MENKGKDMTEKNISVTVKTRKGSLVTFRGDEPEEFVERVKLGIIAQIESTVLALEELISESNVTVVDTVVHAMGGTVISTEPWEAEQSTFAPVPPPPGAAATPPSGMGSATRACVHGNMTKREGSGQWGPYKAFYCPTPKGAPDQCKPVYVKPNEADWNNF